MISFFSLIIGVIYVAHVMGCLWIHLGWEESCKKENRGRILNENFDFNPKNLRVIANKPTEKLKLYEEHKTGEGDDQLNKKLEVLGSIPKKKYPFPMTAA